MQALTSRQLGEISRLIEDYHAAFMVNVLGVTDGIDPKVIDRLKKSGMISPHAKNLPEDTFLFGFVSDALNEAEKQRMTYSAFKSYLKRRPLPLTQDERYAVKHLKRSLMTHLKGLGNTVDKSTHRVLVDADQNLRRRLSQHVKRELVEGMERRKSMSEVATSLRQHTKDFARDWLRIVSTEMNNAYQEGKLQTIIKSNKGRDPMVFKRPRPECCPECREHYLTKGGKVPRLFRMSEIINNGSNVGRKRDERRAVIGSHHPWCQCELHEMPPGFEFDKLGNLVYVGFEG